MTATRLRSAMASAVGVVEVIWPFCVAIVLLVGLSIFRADVMSAMRAYVGGESLWSKGQRDAYFHLDRYARSFDESDYRRFQHAVAVCLGDRVARDELEKPDPDLGVARRGFLDGGNDPADVSGLIWLFRNFHDVDGVATAIDIWSRADLQIAELTRTAAELHAGVQAHAGPVQLQPLVDRIDSINARLVPLELAFSSTLGESSRRTEELLNQLLLAIGATCLVLGAMLSRRALRLREHAVAALAVSEERYALAVEGANDGIWDYDAVNQRVFYSQRVRDMLGYDQSVLGPDPEDLQRIVLPDDYPAARAAVDRHWQERRTSVLRYRMRMRTSDNRVLWILARSKTIYAADGSPLRMAGSYTDITEQVENELQLRLAASVFESNQQAILIVDNERNVVSVNQAFCDLSGYTRDELIGRSVSGLRSPNTDPEAYAQVWQAVLTQGHWRGETVARTREGEDHPVEASIVRVIDPRNNREFYIYSGSDISERKYAAARIQHLAYVDGLTGLPNRSYASAHFEQLLIAARTTRNTLAVVFFDLDGLKEVNDALGHSAGDKVIVEHARRLRAWLPDQDLVCRFGGDEFVAFLPGRDGPAAVAIARDLIASLATRFSLDGCDVAITASAGVSAFPADAGDAETLIRAADTALYRAKALGKNTVVQFRADMDRAVARRFDLISALRHAVDTQQFVLRFQPILDCTSLQVVAAEALVYWEHPELGTTSPSTFIHLAEESGLIESLGAWVIEKAVLCLGEWAALDIAPPHLSINLSTLQLRQPQQFIERLDAALACSAIEPQRIVLEITERQIVHDLAITLPVLTGLAQRGVGLAIDDFGTGYSSLSYLKTLPVTQIKIDIAFIRNLATDAGDRVIVRSIIDLGRSLRLGVVAEGVETREQLALLREYGCPSVQGYLFAKPLSSTDFVEFSRRQQVRVPRNGAAELPARQRPTLG
jgi:diguanylate cyclase (GGDEF)-like protein/PAS domain S-box-containing protein